MENNNLSNQNSDHFHLPPRDRKTFSTNFIVRNVDSFKNKIFSSIINLDFEKKNSANVLSDLHALCEKNIFDSLTPYQLRVTNFEKFLREIKSLMRQCKFRKVLEDILSREDLFYDLEIFWKIREYKIKCMLKILEKKMFKSGANLNSKNKSIENWNSKIESEIEIWIGLLSIIKCGDSSEIYEEQIEALIHVFLEELYIQAQYKFSLKILPEALAILAIGEKIIKMFCDFSRSSKVLQSAQKIYLFISSLLISDFDFEASKVYQINSIKYSLKELFLRIDVEDGIFYEKLSKTNQHFINKIFLNLIFALYHRGVCDESLCNMSKAIDSYKQCIWLSNSFIRYEFPELSQFLTDLDDRAKQYHKLATKILDKLDSEEYNLRVEKLENAKNKKLFKMSKNKIKKNFDLEKEKNIRKIIDAIKHQEFEYLEDVNKSEKLKSIMSTLNLLNNFSSDKFKDLLKILPDSNLENIDKSFVEKIQKRLNDLRAEKKFSEMQKNRFILKNKNRTEETKNIKIEIDQYINKDKIIPEMKNIFQRKTINNLSLNLHMNTERLISDKNSDSTSPNSRAKKKIFSLTSNIYGEAPKLKEKYNTLTVKSRPMSYRHSKNTSDKIEKYNYNEYIFSPDFQKKKNLIDEKIKKETDFQKKLLRLKKFEKIPLDIENNDINNIKLNAKSFFDRAKSGNKPLNNYNIEGKTMNSNNLVDMKKLKIEKYNEKLQVTLIKSLDLKVLSLIEKIKKNEEKKDNFIRDEFKQKNIDGEKSLKDSHKINIDYLKKLEKDIMMIDKEEDICKKIMNNSDSTKKNNSKNFSRNLKKKSTNVKLADNFINNKIKNGYSTFYKFSSITKSENNYFSDNKNIEVLNKEERNIEKNKEKNKYIDIDSFINSKDGIDNLSLVQISNNSLVLK